MVWAKFLMLVLLNENVFGKSVQKRALNGQDAKIEDHPYQVSLRVAGQHYCGGAIISEKHILTAAHCIMNPLVLLIGVTVHTGTGSRENSGHVHGLTNFGAHPKFGVSDDKHLQHDIAVLVLNDTINFDKYQQKINLPEKKVEGGMSVNLTGWGLTSQAPDVHPVNLQILKTTISTRSECDSKMSAPLELEQFCTIREKGFGACHGDSGGPLVANGEIIGVVSWGADPEKRCAIGVPDIYMDVFAYKEFITYAMNNETLNDPNFNFTTYAHQD